MAAAAAAGEEQIQLTPHDMWEWNRETHWKNWHGLWQLWRPQQSREVSKAYRVVRALRADDEHGFRLHHRNQWFGCEGPGSEIQWENGPWLMTEQDNSLLDGIRHENKDDFRILQFQNGDLGWLQLSLKPGDPNCVVFGEVHFMLPDKNGRMPVILGYFADENIGAALMLEEVRETDEKPDADWHGSVFDHKAARLPLEEHRQEPDGEFVGEEKTLTTGLLMKKVSGVKWNGFRGDVPAEDCEWYSTVHLPCAVTAFLPSKAAIGKEHEFVVSWVVSEAQVRMISWKYNLDGKLVHIKSGDYKKH